MFQLKLFTSIAALMLLTSNGRADQEVYLREHGFAISVPSSWTIKPGATDGTLFKAVFRDAQDRVAILAIIKQPVRSGTKIGTAEQIVAIRSNDPTITSIRKLYGGDGTIANVPGVWVTTETTYIGGLKQFERTYCFIRESILYIATYSTDPDFRFFAGFAPIIDDAISGIEFR